MPRKSTYPRVPGVDPRMIKPALRARARAQAQARAQARGSRSMAPSMEPLDLDAALGETDDDLDLDSDLDEDFDLDGDDLGLPANDDDLLDGGPTSSRSAQNDGSRRLPIMSPVHNMREICKQFVLLEDHLFQPSKHCPDCVRKHLLTSEALAEEAITLDKTGEHRGLLAKLPEKIRNMQRAILSSESQDNRSSVAQSAREIRKVLSGVCFSLVADGMGDDSSSSKESPGEYERRAIEASSVDAGSVSDVPMTLARAQDMAAGYLLRGARWFDARKGGLGEDDEGQAEWWGFAAVNARNLASTVGIIYGSGKKIKETTTSLQGKVYEVERAVTPTRVIEAVARHLAEWTPKNPDTGERFSNPVAVVAGNVALAMGKANVDNDWTPDSLPMPEPGAAVACFSYDQWWLGRVADVGYSCDGKIVRTISRNDLPVIWEQNGECYRFGDASMFVALAPKASRMSSELANSNFVKFSGDGAHSRPVRLSESQGLMVDVIQAVLRDKLGNVGPMIGIDSDDWDFVVNRVILAAVVNAWYESALDPVAVGDAGKSVGLFQLRVPGLGSGMSNAQRKNPILNTLRVAREFFDLIRRGKLSTALAMEKESIEQGGLYDATDLVAEWTKVWTRQIEKPSRAAVKSKDRADTAYVVLTDTLPPDRQAASGPPVRSIDDLVPSGRKILGRKASRDLIAQGGDSGLASDFVARHGAVKAVKEAVFFEQRAATHKGNGDPRRSRMAVDAAIDRWQQAGEEIKSNWPFARAAYLCRALNSPSCEYQVLRRMVKVKPEGHEPDGLPNPGLQLARRRMIELESTHPRAFLLTPVTAESKRNMAKTAVAAGGIVATVVLALAAAGKLVFGDDSTTSR